jgi:hypothetical protein
MSTGSTKECLDRIVDVEGMCCCGSKLAVGASKTECSTSGVSTASSTSLHSNESRQVGHLFASLCAALPELTGH